MDEARQRLSVSVDKATASAKRVREHVVAANQSASRVAKFSGTVEVKLGQLYAHVTPELRPEVNDIQNDVSAEKQEEIVLTEMLTKAISAEQDLSKELQQAQTDKVELTKESQAYATKAQELAQKATDENTAKIKAQKSAISCHLHSWLFKIGSALAVVIIVGIAILWLTGGLAKLAAKFI